MYTYDWQVYQCTCCTCFAHNIELLMKVYFTCSTAEFVTYRDYYFQIRNHVIDKGHTLTRDWLPNADLRIRSGQLDMDDVKVIYKECVKSIRESDLVIIEDTVSNFSTGHQISLALQYKKPTLVLWKGKKHRQFKKMFIHGIDSDILQVSEYEEGSLEKVIDVFLEKFEDADEKNRFHLVLSNLERRYLDWAQLVQEKSRTQIIREALRKEIDSNSDYIEYLNNHSNTHN